MEERKRKRKKKKKEEKVGGWEVFDFLFGLRQKRRTKGGLYLYGKKTRLLFVYFTMSRPEAASVVSWHRSLVPYHVFYVTDGISTLVAGLTGPG